MRRIGLETVAVNKFIHQFTETKTGVFQILLGLFAAVTFFTGKFLVPGTDAELLLYILAAAELAAAVGMKFYYKISENGKSKELKSYLESFADDTESARGKTLLSFPMPMVVFRAEDTGIIWGNKPFFRIFGETGTKLDAKVSDLIPNFDSRWLQEGKTEYPELIEIHGKKYNVHGSYVKQEGSEESFMCITYWVDVTEYDAVRVEYEESRPIAGIVIIDNYEEMVRNLPDRAKNDVRDAVEDKLFAWIHAENGFIRRYDRDRYLFIAEKRDLLNMKKDKFPILQGMHSVESPNGFSASISIGIGEDAGTISEAVHLADMAVELALSRGGDQTVIKTDQNFEFFGGRGGEVEKRTNVRSRLMANTMVSLVKDSSQVFIMGHRYADMDCIGAAAGICCLARTNNIPCHIIVDDTSDSESLIDLLRSVPEYKNVFFGTREAKLRTDGRTLLVIVDTNRPEQIEDKELLDSCSRVAVIDHHRVSATFIHNAALGFIEPYASSTSELVSEILLDTVEPEHILKTEADALLAGIVLDTKNFTIRTGERTFEAASFLRARGAEPIAVKKLLQTDMENTVKKYRILQNASLYRNVVAIASPEDSVPKIVVAKAADELLNISGVEASIVVAPSETGEILVSARSIGDLNVQLIMEKIGGGGNRGAAAARISDKTLEEAVELVHASIDDYLSA